MNNHFFAKVRSIVVLGVVCMLVFAAVGCDASKVDEECVFDLSELNEANCISRWAVELTLKSGITNCPTENSRIKALVAEHNVTFRPSFPGTSDTVLMRYYTLIGEDCSNLCYVRAVIRAFLAIGLFEHVRVFGIYSIAN